MTKKLQIYKCEKCGNIIEVLHDGPGELSCCGAPMTLYEEKTEDAGKEKHLPLVEKTDTQVKVYVGGVSHPMEDSHFIEWIEVITDGGSFKKFLLPTNKPAANFNILKNVKEVRIYCNIHGLWSRKF
ncbi:MAG: desulfoferrodoxin [Candidatus Methanofastidiosia archaeon]